jgi:hypothetical protein
MEEGLIESNNCSGNEYIAESFFVYAAISSGTASQAALVRILRDK